MNRQWISFNQLDNFLWLIKWVLRFNEESKIRNAPKLSSETNWSANQIKSSVTQDTTQVKLNGNEHTLCKSIIWHTFSQSYSYTFRGVYDCQRLRTANLSQNSSVFEDQWASKRGGLTGSIRPSNLLIGAEGFPAAKRAPGCSFGEWLKYY